MRARFLTSSALIAATNGALAIAYIALARLGLLAAIPPGNITAVWPPSGLAVATLLIFGWRRAIPGVWLGAFIVNGWIMADGSAPLAMPLAATIAIGSALQTLAIAELLRRYVWRAHTPWAGPVKEARLRSPVRTAGLFVALAALGCLIAATIGVTSFWLAGLLAPTGYAYAWGIWWLGDWAGILAITPPLLALAAWLRNRPQVARMAIAVIGLGLAASVGLFLVLRALEDQRIAIEFAGDAQTAQIAVSRSIEQSNHDLEVINALYAASDSVNRDEFRVFVQPHLSGPGATPGLQALGWARYVPASERQSFEAAGQRLGTPDFQIVEQDARGQPVRAGDRAEYFPVEYVEPAAANTRAFGYDLASEPTRRAAMERARGTGQSSVATPMTLVSNAQPGLIRFWPIYRKGSDISTVAARRANLIGLIYGAYRLPDLIDAGLFAPEWSDLDFYVFGAQAPDRVSLLHLRSAPGRLQPLAAPAGLQPADLRSGTFSAEHVDVASQDWELVATPAPAYIESRRTLLPWGALVFGLLLTGWAAAELAQRQRVADALQNSEQRFRALIEKSANAVVLVSADGEMIYTSPNYEKLLGYPLASPIGESAFAIVVPEDAGWVIGLFQELVAQPGSSASAEFRVRHADGSIRWIASTATNLLDDPAVGAIVTNMSDITERKEAERELLHLREAVSASHEAMFLTDRDGVFTWINPAFTKLYGYAPDEVVGRVTPRILKSGLTPLECYQAFWADILAKRTVQDEIVNRTKSGDLVTIDRSVSPVLDGTGEISAFLTIQRDITERKQAEALLQASETRYRLLFENSHDLIQSVDTAGHFLLVNPAWLRTLEYSEAELLSLRLWDIIHPDSLVQCQAEFESLLAGVPVGMLQPILISKSGQAVEVEGIAVPVLVDGQVVATNAFFRDVTARRQADRIQAAQFAANRIMAESPDLSVALVNVAAAIATSFAWTQAQLWYCDPSDDQIHWAEAWHARGQVPIAPSVRSYSRGEGLPGAARLSGQAIAAAAFISGELQSLAALPIANGTDVWGVIEFFGQAARPVDQALLAMLTDLGRQVGQFVARKQAEIALDHERTLLARRVDERTADLSRANRDLVRALHAKDSFLANMSHELRTPLNGILAMSEILTEQIHGPLNQRQLRSIEIVESSGRHLLSLINDILDLSKIEAGKLELQIDVLRIDDICQASLSFIREMATKKGLRVTYRCNDPLAYMQGDARRLKQILVNLLSNAVKFTPNGGEVLLETTADAEQELVRFVVEDTGIGIAAADLGRLFQPFSQLDTSLSRAHEGTGLGLALVSRLAEQHGGSVGVESAGVPGQGSCFTVTLPWKHAATQAAAEGGEPAIAPAAQAPTAAVVLLAEDNEANIQVVGDYLEHLGYRLIVARDGREAIERATETRPDIVLMDVQMPQMDGLTATRQLRTLPEFASTPIVALTALAMPGDRERCLQAGVNEYLSKPVGLKRLAGLIEQLLAQAS